jgi:hypothetical protein
MYQIFSNKLDGKKQSIKQILSGNKYSILRKSKKKVTDTVIKEEQIPREERRKKTRD